MNKQKQKICDDNTYNTKIENEGNKTQTHTNLFVQRAYENPHVILPEQQFVFSLSPGYYLQG